MHHKMNNKHHKLLLFFVVAALILAFFLFPDFFVDAFMNLDYGLISELVLFLPGFLLLLGILEALLPEKLIVEHLGKHSNWKGGVLSFLLGMIFPGPLYLAFPLAAILRKKGVSWFNITLFLSVKSCLTVAEEVFELQFMGLEFMLLRILLTIPVLIILSFAMEKVSSIRSTKN